MSRGAGDKAKGKTFTRRPPRLFLSITPLSYLLATYFVCLLWLLYVCLLVFGGFFFPTLTDNECKFCCTGNECPDVTSTLNDP